MTFKKPDNVRYVDMCIYIDDNIYNEDGFNEETVYKYLYHLCYMLAKNKQFFKKHCYYDDFAIFAANRVFFRLINKKQFELNADGTPRMEKIKSVLNYIKTILYPLKVDFEQSEYCQTISPNKDIEPISFNFNNLLNNSINKVTFSDFELTFQNVGLTCRKFLETLPYKKDSKDWLNIYVSVMLTFMNSITLTNKTKRRLTHLTNTMRLRDYHINNAYDKENLQKAILYHLPESMNNYIIVLARQLKNIIAKDLCEILHTKVSNDILVTALSVQEYKDIINEEQYEY